MAPQSTGGDTLLRGRLDTFRTLAWLADDPRPLDWNGPADRLFTRFRDEDLQRPIIEHFERVARRQPDRIAIRDANTALTFGELWDGVSGLAETLAAETGPGDLIGILLPAGPMFPLAMLACLASGRPFVALDTHYPPDWLDHVLQDARPTLIITLEAGLPDVETRMPTLRVIRLTGLPGSAHRGWRPAAMGVDEPACVLFTSGSTGRPKGIVNSQRNLLQRVAQSINAAHVNPADRLLTLASPCTIVGVRDVLTALLAGASIHLLDPQGVGAREIVTVIRAEAITILFAFPALLRSIVAARDERADAALRLVRVGGDTTLWSDIEVLRAWLAPGAAIQLIYAATEAPMMQWFVDDTCRREEARIPIGYPLPGNRLALGRRRGRRHAAGRSRRAHRRKPIRVAGTLGRRSALRTRALKQMADANAGCFVPETSCASGPTDCWNESAARTGKSRSAGLASISMASKPSFADTHSCEMSPRWHGRAAPMARRRSSHMSARAMERRPD